MESISRCEHSQKRSQISALDDNEKVTHVSLFRSGLSSRKRLSVFRGLARHPPASSGRALLFSLLSWHYLLLFFFSSLFSVPVSFARRSHVWLLHRLPPVPGPCCVSSAPATRPRLTCSVGQVTPSMFLAHHAVLEERPSKAARVDEALGALSALSLTATHTSTPPLRGAIQ